MAATRYNLDDLLASSAGIGHLAGRLMGGDIGILPTETIYGISGRADNALVKQRIYEAKNRPTGNPFIVVAAERSSFDCLNIRFPLAAQKLAARFWPGRLTLIVPQTDGSEFVAVRTSDHPLLNCLYRFMVAPMFSTSANLSGVPYAGAPETLYKLFKDRVDFVVDAGRLPVSPPSTIVKVYEDYRIGMVREGAISEADIEQALQEFPFEIERESS